VSIILQAGPGRAGKIRAGEDPHRPDAVLRRSGYHGIAVARTFTDDEKRMGTMPQPRIRSLNREECERILARNHVGRLAYARGNQVDIEPLHYVMAGGWLYGRTSPGNKLEVTGEQWWPVAFEVDEVEGLFRWRSVVVHGGFYAIHEDGPEWEQSAHGKGVTLLRELIPQTFTADDPVAFRTVLFRIAVQEVSGREATPGEQAAEAT
jgi:nitroimidazol reductase NimA-like FMN-containing flavoprotein (pyridoxamine 5'-phosphate oxidase superfamily)